MKKKKVEKIKVKPLPYKLDALYIKDTGEVYIYPKGKPQRIFTFTPDDVVHPQIASELGRSMVSLINKGMNSSKDKKLIKKLRKEIKELKELAISKANANGWNE